jgi:hypothetical protein
MFSLLSGHDLKRASEWDLFARFCKAGRIEVDPAEIEMLDPPWPDLKVDVLGHYRYFELGEIVQEDWVKALARSEKKPIFHSPLPLITVWSPLASMIQKKAMKRYVPEATPLSLLLYWSRNAPKWTAIKSLVSEREREIRSVFQNSVFDHMWVFMANENRISFSMSKKMIVPVK